MSEGKSSISQASTDEEMGEFWDTHSIADYWDQTAPAEFQINIERRAGHYALDHTLDARLRALAQRRGVLPETLLHLLVLERLQELQPPQELAPEPDLQEVA